VSKRQIAGGGEATDVMCRSLLGLADRAITAIWLVDPKKRNLVGFLEALACCAVLFSQSNLANATTVQ